MIVIFQTGKKACLLVLVKIFVYLIVFFLIFSGTPNVRELLVVGGTSVNDQIRTLQAGVDIVVATPGRLEDLIQNGSLSLTQCRFFILDEADGLLKV